MERQNECIPESQRTTIPTPMPFAGVADRVKPSVGMYVIVNERTSAKEKRARRTAVAIPR